MLGDTENLVPEAGGAMTAGLHPCPPSPILLPREIWKLRDLVLFLAFVPFALVVSKLIVLVGYAVLRPFTGWQVKVEAAQTGTVFMLVQQCILYAFALAFLFLLAKLQHQQPFWKSLGWKNPGAKQVAGYLAGGAALAVATSWGLWLFPDTQAFPLEKLFDSRTTSYALGIFAISFAPIIEEVVFRGLLFAIVEGAMGLRFAVLITALLFAGLHIQEYWHAWNHLALILGVGIVFSLARGMTGSLTPSIILHIGYNSLLMTGFFTSQHFRAASGF